MAADRPMTNKEMEAEQDARTLGEAEEIKLDRPRLGAAKKAAVKVAQEKKKQAAGMERVSTITPAPGPAAKKPPATSKRRRKR